MMIIATRKIAERPVNLSIPEEKVLPTLVHTDRFPCGIQRSLRFGFLLRAVIQHDKPCPKMRRKLPQKIK